MAAPTSGKAGGGNAKILWIVIFGVLGLAGVFGFVTQREAPEQAAAPETAPAQAPAPAVETAPAPQAAAPVASEPVVTPTATATSEAQPAPEAPAEAQAEATQATAADPAAQAATEAPAAQDATTDTAAAAVVPAAPETAAPAPLPDPIAPSLDLVRVDAEGRAIVAGQAEPGSRVTLRLDGQEIDSVTADRAGNFVAMMRLDPSDRPRVLSLESVVEGNAPVMGAETAIIAPFAGPAAVVAEAETQAPQTQATQAETTQAQAAPAASQAVEEVATEQAVDATAPAIVVAGADGLRVLQDADAASQPGADSVTQLDAISYDALGALTLAGRGPAATTLRVFLDGREIQTGQTDASGQWSLDLSDDVAPGTYDLRIEHLDASGQVVGQFETPFRREDPARIRDNPMLADPGSSVIAVQRGFTLWGIAEANFGSGFLYVQIFQENREAIRDPDLIFPGQIFALPDLPRTSVTP